MRALYADERCAYLLSEKQFEQEFTVTSFTLNILNCLKYRILNAFKYADPAGLGKKYVNNAELWLKTEDMVRKAMEL